MHKRGKTFEQILRQGMIHQILANDRFWMRQRNVLVQRYEDLISEPARSVTELADHLGIALTPGEAERIAALYSQESNRARTEALKQRLEQAGVDLEQHRQHSDLRPLVALALESYAAEGRSLLAHGGDAAAAGDLAPALRPMARVARLFPGGETANGPGIVVPGVCASRCGAKSTSSSAS